MANDYSDPYRDTVKFAGDVLDMHNEIMRLRAQVERLEYYKEEYFKLTNRMLEDNERLVGDVILAAIDSFADNQENSES